MKFYICATAETIFPAPVLSMGRTGKYGAENYRLMEAFQLWLNENGLFDQDTVIYGIPMGARIKPSPPVAVTRSVLLFPDIRSPHEAPSNAGHCQAAVS